MNELERGLAFLPKPSELEYLKKLPVSDLPLISVVIPSFNQAKFLRQTLDSVLSQNYPALEIFVADGGSKDGSVAILEEYASRHSDLLKFDSQPDGGHQHGVNKGIAKTRGDVIAWINSDDVYLPDAFWKVATFFYFNRMALLVYGRNRYVNKELGPVTDYPVDWSPLIEEQRRRMMHFCLVPQPSLFFRRVAVTLCGALNSPIVDYELWMRWQKNIPFYFLDDYLSLSRLHDDAITANADHKLLRGICSAVHENYGAVPYSWAFKYAYTVVYGAAWARGESPTIGVKVRFLSYWYWISLNFVWLPKLFKRTATRLFAWLKQVRRISA
jgi:glycosyltransferase involved in cell wall biosynthesis